MSGPRARRIDLQQDSIASGPEMDLRKVGVSRFDPRDPYHFAITLKWHEFFLCLLAAELVANLVFAGLYVLQPGSIANAREGSLTDAFFFSLETLATVGYGAMSPGSLYGHVVSAAEILFGLTLTAVFTGLIFVRFSRPRAKVIYADKAVVTTFEGAPALMLRIGNGRLNIVGDARATLSAVVLVETKEGHQMRRLMDLKLVRSHFPLFVLTWTLVHVIDEASPLHEATPESLADGEFRLVLSFEGRDFGIASTVYDMRAYSASDIVFGMRYANLIERDTPNRTVADMTKISLIEPDARPA